MTFLASVYSEVRSVSDSGSVDNGRAELGHAIRFEILDIFGSYLGLDIRDTAAIRDSLGKDTNIMLEMAQDLAKFYDDVSLRNHGVKSREVALSDLEQRALISLVRALGNFSFQCQHNQDLVRTILVPRLGESNGRSCMHVLISATSLSHKCFTLREWGLVALRYLIENNPTNQQVLAELEAQQPVQSAELSSMGIRVDLDSKGNAKVVPSEKLNSVTE